MNPSQEEASSAYCKFVQESLQLQEYAKQLQIHLERVALQLSQEGTITQIYLAQMQDRVKQIEEHASLMGS